MVASGHATMVVDIKETGDHTKATFRFFIGTNALFSKNISTDLKFIFGKDNPVSTPTL
jgi:hypothetical protein